MFCPQCGLEIPNDSKFCHYCGNRITGPDKQINEQIPRNNAPDTHNNNARKSKRSNSVLAIIVVSVIVVAFVGIGIYLITSGFASEEAQIDFSDLSKRVLYVEVFDKENQLLGNASGFVVNDGSAFVTNYHVIAGANRIVAHSFDDAISASFYEAFVANEDADIAILPCPRTLSEFSLCLGDSSTMKQGDKVFAAGYPLGITNTLSDGLVSSIYRDENQIPLLQITAPISAGSSGGALFNEKGEVVGVTSASYIGGENMNLAIASSILEELLNANNSKSLPFSSVAPPASSQTSTPDSMEIDPDEPTPVNLEDLYNNPTKYDGCLIICRAWNAYYAYQEPIDSDSFIEIDLVNDTSCFRFSEDEEVKYLEDIDCSTLAKIVYDGYLDEASIPYVTAVIHSKFIVHPIDRREAKMIVVGRFSYNPSYLNGNNYIDDPYLYQIDVEAYGYDD